MSAKVQWTAAQQAAINTRGSNLLVAAAAGSGKTAVLVERIITMITEEESPVDLDRLLIVTFTKAAASEMKERIGEAVIKKIEEYPKDKRLHRQLSLLNKASITTIHSFCLEVIRNHFHVVELDPHFRIADEFEVNLLKIEALDELFEELYENKENTLFASLVECYGGKKDDGQLVSMIQSLYNFVQSSPWPKRWLEEMAEAFQVSKAVELDQQPWMKMLKETLSVELEGIGSTIEQAIYITRQPDGPVLYEEALLADLHIVEELQQVCKQSFSKGYEAFQNINWTPFSRKKQSCDEDLKEKVKKLRDEAKKAVDRIKKKVFFRESSELLTDLQKLYPLMKELVRVTLLFDERFKNKKKERNVLDFNDLEHYCLEILIESVEADGKVTPSEVALQYKKKFEEVLIDEYQDSNLVQETLLSLVSRKEQVVPNLFMVGDVKQSIYRFRMAKPELFLEKYNTFSMKEGALNLRIDLDQNFRSRENILYGINFIFNQIMTETMGEMDYDEKAALYPGANYPELEEGEAGGAIELHLIEKNNIEDEKEDAETYEEEIIEELEPVQIEARLIVKRIRELMKQQPPFKVFDKEQKRYRSMQYKDIVILLRATQNWAPIFVEELLKENIPAYADASTGYFNAIEIQIILSVLKIIDNPRQDLPLITVLRSSIVGISADDLATLREVGEERDFYDTLLLFTNDKEYMNATNHILFMKIEKFLNQLERWRLKARLLTVQELLQMIYLETQYFHFVGALPGGVQRQANLTALIDRAKGFENSSIKGLFHFVSFIEKLKNRGEEMGLAKIMGENENVVRIMSIHKSKGLEFPVVFAAGMGKAFNLLDMNQPILLHQEYGLGPIYIDFEKRVQYSSLPRIAIKEKVYKETLSEEMRILYVALTRAKEKLILIGSERDIGKKCEKWSRTVDRETIKLPPYHMLKAKNYLDWIGPCIARHQQGLLIREMAGVVAQPQFFNTETSEWKVYYHEPSTFIQQAVEEIKEESKLKQQLQQGNILTKKSIYSEEIVRRLEWEYQYKKYSEMPAKISVSQIKKLQIEQKKIVFESAGPQNYSIPKFMKEKQKLTGAEKGTLIHNVMQYLDFNRCENKNQIVEQLDHLIERKLLTLEQKNQISVTQLLKFFESSLAKRMIASEELKKEIPFIMEFEYEGVEGVLLQGVIDAYFKEGEELILVDYKTDYTTPEKIDEIVKKYKVQLEYYSAALEKILGLRVKEKYLYLFSVEQAVLV